MIAVLGRAYHNVLRQFLDENKRREAANDEPQLRTLRLLPISGGIFAGSFQGEIAPLTMRALSQASRVHAWFPPRTPHGLACPEAAVLASMHLVKAPE